MAAVLNFNERLAAKRNEEENKKYLEFFKGLFAEANASEKELIREAIETKNETLYKEVTTPIIMRQVMKQVNK